MAYREVPGDFPLIAIVAAWLSPCYAGLWIALMARPGLWKAWIGPCLVLTTFVPVLAGLASAAGLMIIAGITEPFMAPQRLDLVDLVLRLLFGLVPSFFLLLAGWGLVAIVRFHVPRRCSSCGTRRAVPDLRPEGKRGPGRAPFGCLRCGAASIALRDARPKREYLVMIEQEPIRWIEG